MDDKILLNNYIKGNENIVVNMFGLSDKDIENNKIINKEYERDNISRTQKVVDSIKRFAEKYKNNLSKPIIRCYGLFSDLAMVKETINDKSDRTLLLSEEKESFNSLIKRQFMIKQIISLDIGYVIGSRGYSMDKWEGRTEQLIGELKYLEHSKNLNIVYDYEHRNCNIFILGDELLIKAIEMNKEQGYTNTLFTNDPNEIQQAIKEFDFWFANLEKEKRILMRQLGTSDTYMVCEQLSRIRRTMYDEQFPQ